MNNTDNLELTLEVIRQLLEGKDIRVQGFLDGKWIRSEVNDLDSRKEKLSMITKYAMDGVYYRIVKPEKRLLRVDELPRIFWIPVRGTRWGDPIITWSLPLSISTDGFIATEQFDKKHISEVGMEWSVDRRETKSFWVEDDT